MCINMQSSKDFIWEGETEIKQNPTMQQIWIKQNVNFTEG